MTIRSPSKRASCLTVNQAHVLLQMSDTPIIFGCAESIANRLARGKNPLAIKSKTDHGVPQYHLNSNGLEVKEKLEKWLKLA